MPGYSWIEAEYAAPRPVLDYREAPEALGILNARRGSGLFRSPPVAWDPALATAAWWHAADMAVHSWMRHEGSNGTSFLVRARAAGFRGDPMGECVAAGQRDAASVISSWSWSPGHWAIINARRATHVGVAVARSWRGEPYWCLVTGRR